MSKPMSLDWKITVERLDAQLALWRGDGKGARELIVAANLEHATFGYESGKGGLKTEIRLNALTAGDAKGKTFLWTEEAPFFQMELRSWEKRGERFNDLRATSAAPFIDVRLDVISQLLAIFEPEKDRIMRGVKTTIAKAYEAYLQEILNIVDMPSSRVTVSVDINLKAPNILLHSRNAETGRTSTTGPSEVPDEPGLLISLGTFTMRNDDLKNSDAVGGYGGLDSRTEATYDEMMDQRGESFSIWGRPVSTFSFADAYDGYRLTFSDLAAKRILLSPGGGPDSITYVSTRLDTTGHAQESVTTFVSLAHSQKADDEEVIRLAIRRLTIRETLSLPSVFLNGDLPSVNVIAAADFISTARSIVQQLTSDAQNGRPVEESLDLDGSGSATVSPIPSVRLFNGRLVKMKLLLFNLDFIW